MLSGAPVGYRYQCKIEESAAYYEVIEAEAEIVRRVFDLYTVKGLSIGAIARCLNELDLATRKRLLPLGAFHGLGDAAQSGLSRGTACFGKTTLAPRKPHHPPAAFARGQGCPRNRASHERSRAEWIEIPVPALVSEETFALAQEFLEHHQRHGRRRTLEPGILQGLVGCRRCGYALYRTSTRSSARKIYYYRCRPVPTPIAMRDRPCVTKNRSDRTWLYHVVWSEILRLLEDPSLIQSELSRRLETARQASPTQRRLETLTRESARVRKHRERLLTAYQEELLSLDELRARMPAPCDNASRRFRRSFRY